MIYYLQTREETWMADVVRCRSKLERSKKNSTCTIKTTSAYLYLLKKTGVNRLIGDNKYSFQLFSPLSKSSAIRINNA